MRFMGGHYSHDGITQNDLEYGWANISSEHAPVVRYYERSDERSWTPWQDENDVLLYVHGFNTKFHKALERAAGLARDLQLHFTIVVFSWPSRGEASLWAYKDDETCINSSPVKRHLVDLLEQLSSRTADQSRKLHLIAHSLGCRLLARTLADLVSPYQYSVRQESQEDTTLEVRNTAVRGKFGHIIFGAADADAGQFRDWFKRFRVSGLSITLYVHALDLALYGSNLYHIIEQHRAGQAWHILNSHRFRQPYVIEDGLTTVDCSDIHLEDDPRRHGYLFLSDMIMLDIGYILTGKTPLQRAGEENDPTENTEKQTLERRGKIWGGYIAAKAAQVVGLTLLSSGLRAVCQDDNWFRIVSEVA